jgi:hypothetical protein
MEVLFRGMHGSVPVCAASAFPLYTWRRCSPQISDNITLNLNFTSGSPSDLLLAPDNRSLVGCDAVGGQNRAVRSRHKELAHRRKI